MATSYEEIASSPYAEYYGPEDTDMEITLCELAGDHPPGRITVGRNVLSTTTRTRLIFLLSAIDN